jgi:uncharacterized protein YjbI with pentapeptide repeats
MKTKIEIKSVLGSVLFKLEKENNSLNDTIIEAVKSGADLRYAYLRYADLRCADLRCADLRSADLRSADLRCADLSGANLGCADLRSADLRSADLRSADLRYAYLRYADLRCADLRYADLRCADLRCADLRCADLRCADLSGANLGCADLRSADLRSADLRSADLRYAYLRYADLRSADLSGAKNIPFIPTYLPEGEFVAWKKLENGLIVKLKILEDSKRSRSTTDKCRCDKCLVLEFQNQDGSKSDLKTFTNKNYSECAYTVGEIVKADSWDENRWNECSHGIHFFIDRQSAVDY